tara:strand:+ start:1795 stop:3078 length:1284 start_codon:yes stop_codon:yes gene_type:complete
MTLYTYTPLPSESTIWTFDRSCNAATIPSNVHVEEEEDSVPEAQCEPLVEDSEPEAQSEHQEEHAEPEAQGEHQEKDAEPEAQRDPLDEFFTREEVRTINSLNIEINGGKVSGAKASGCSVEFEVLEKAKTRRPRTYVYSIPPPTTAEWELPKSCDVAFFFPKRITMPDTITDVMQAAIDLPMVEDEDWMNATHYDKPYANDFKKNQELTPAKNLLKPMKPNSGFIGSLRSQTWMIYPSKRDIADMSDFDLKHVLKSINKDISVLYQKQQEVASVIRKYRHTILCNWDEAFFHVERMTQSYEKALMLDLEKYQMNFRDDAKRWFANAQIAAGNEYETFQKEWKESCKQVRMKEKTENLQLKEWTGMKTKETMKFYAECRKKELSRFQRWSDGKMNEISNAIRSVQRVKVNVTKKHQQLKMFMKMHSC